jgi:Protein of unknown function (DUF2782)
MKLSHSKESNMQKLTFKSLFLCVLLALSLPQAGLAAAPANAEPLEDIPPPPKVQDGEAIDEPEITIRKKGTETVEEYRIHGELYMMKVTPEHGVPYYLHKEDQDGGWTNVGPNKPLSIPKWIIFRF